MNYRIWKEINDLRDLKKGEGYTALVAVNGLEVEEVELVYSDGKWCFNDLSGEAYSIEDGRIIIAIECELEDILHNRFF